MEQLRYWLALHHALGGTPRTAQLLLNIFESPEVIINTHKKNPSHLQITPLQHQRLHQLDWSLIDEDLAWQQSNSAHHIITCDDSRYPSDLKEIYDPPLILYVKGTPDYLHQSQLAVVGSRNPSLVGEKIAHTFAQELSLAGLVITSGMAIGIDYQAHQGALMAKKPTLAVLGSGMNKIYPKNHLNLSDLISENGAIISEQPVNMPAIAANFPKRNRIISGLSLGTLVIEASLKSGSLITARLANEQGRDVFAIPGSITNPLSHGCHYLLKNGAKLTESSNDLLEELGLRMSINKPKTDVLSTKCLDPIDNKLVECLGFCTQSTQDLINCTGISAKDICSRLLNLELHGYIKTVPGGYCRTGTR